MEAFIVHRIITHELSGSGYFNVESNKVVLGSSVFTFYKYILCKAKQM